MQFFGGSDISPSPPAPTASGNNAHMMYVFNRNGVCLLYREWNRPLHTLNAQQDHKLMFGLLFSLKSLTAKMDPTSMDKGNLGVPQLPGQGCSFHSFRTNTYKLSFMETPSGIKIILITHPKTGDLRESLKYIYNLYVEYVVKNPIYTPGAPIRCMILILVYTEQEISEGFRIAVFSSNQDQVELEIWFCKYDFKNVIEL
ncbi:hypothetical protein POTOM_055554 [Populus tomentosa]|uniref:Trafficking protein particle complex subunit n=1 Tax=Populus tomentosa TaxID=118781 RepID=A0A8X8C499_POPTO|nr:hypothetical protein POTOM_055554 [Populus tomentosa]